MVEQRQLAGYPQPIYYNEVSIFLLLALASPLLATSHFFFPFITGKALFFRLIIELAALYFSGLFLLNPGLRQRAKIVIKQPLFICLLVFTAIFTITSLTAVNPQLAFWSNFERAEGGWQMLHYFLFFALLAITLATKDDWLWLFRGQMIIASLIAGYGLLQLLKIPFPWLIAPGGISGTLGNPSYLATYLLLSLFLNSWLIANENRPRLKLLWLILAAFQLFIFFQAQSRAAIIAGALGLFFFLINQAWASRRLYLAAIALLILVIAAGLAFNLKGDFLTALQPRLWTWNSALAGFWEKPLLGWGIENFPLIFDKYYDPRQYGRESFFDRAHNVFLEYATSGGLLLLLAYLAIFYFLFRQSWSWSWSRSLFSFFPLVYLINGLALFEVLPIYLLLFFYTAFSLSLTGPPAAVSRPAPPESRPPGQSRLTLILPLLIILIFSLYFTVYRPLRKNLLLVQALRFEEKTVEQIFTDQLAALRFYSPIGQSEALQNFLTVVLSYLDQAEKPEAAQPLLDLTAALFKTHRPQLVGIKETYLYLLVLLKAQDLKRAGELLAETEKISPRRIELIALKIKLARLNQDWAEEEKSVARLKELRPDLTPEQLNELRSSL